MPARADIARRREIFSTSAKKKKEENFNIIATL
jgi:hypothetical protein